MKNFQEKLKKALKSKGMTQGQLCEKIEMSMDGFKRMIDNDNVKVKTLEQICEILEVDIDYFLDIPVKPTPVGFWKRLVDEATAEAQKWKIRAYELEEQMGIGNFNHVSGRRGGSVRPIFLGQNSLTFSLTK